MMNINTLFHWIEKTILIMIVGLTVGAVLLELLSIYNRKTIVIADILLLFLYTEVISMVSIFYQSRRIPVIYPLLIAITALSRLIVLQSKEMDPQTILFEASAILVLSLAIAALRFSETIEDSRFSIGKLFGENKKEDP